MKPLNGTVSYVVLSLIIAAFATFLAYQLWMDPTQPVAEGFAGPATGAGIPDCLRSSSEAAALYEFLSRRANSKKDAALNAEDGGADEASDDLRELSVILGKFACFKRDLMSPSGIVEATRQQPFYTSHDIEPIAETTARCFAKTIPKRDLDIAFDKWNSRGTVLIKRICTHYAYTEAERDEAMTLFKKAYSDIREVAVGACCSGEPTLAGGEAPRMVHGYEPSDLVLLREYKGYY